jgi:hypothetical protein
MMMENCMEISLIARIYLCHLQANLFMIISVSATEKFYPVQKSIRDNDEYDQTKPSFLMPRVTVSFDFMHVNISS